MILEGGNICVQSWQTDAIVLVHLTTAYTNSVSSPLRVDCLSARTAPTTRNGLDALRDVM